MFTAEAAEFLTGEPLDKKYSNQAKELLETPAGQMFKPYLQSMSGAIQNPQPGMFHWSHSLFQYSFHYSIRNLINNKISKAMKSQKHLNPSFPRAITE